MEENLEKLLHENPYNEEIYHQLIEFYQNSKEDDHDNRDQVTVIDEKEEEDEEDTSNMIGEDENENKELKLNEDNIIIKNNLTKKEKILQLREQYLTYFIPSEEFWLTWILDMIIDVNNKVESIQKLDEIFHKAFDYCPTVRIITEYLDVMNQYYDDEMITEIQMRSTFEKAISICGLDMYDGGTIWSRYKDFEIEELEDCIDLEAPTEVIQEAKKRLVNIFRRQLAQPLSENDTVLQNLDDCLSQMFVESDVDIINPSSISSAYQTGLDLRTVRQPFEDNILSDQFQVLSEDERASRWVNYIDFEIKDNQIFRAQRLYERAVLNCTQSCLLWQNYIYFALNRVKNWVLLESVLSRALKIEGCKQNIECWKVKYLTVELINLKSETTLGQVSLLTPDSENFITCSGQIYNVFQLSTQVKFVNRTYYWMTMKMYCDFFKRYLVQLVTQGSREADLFLALNNLWNALDYVEYYLVNYFGDWEEGWLLYSHYRMNCEDNLIENICESVDGQLENQSIESKSEIVWDRIIQKFPKSYPIWKSYIQWAHNRNKEITFCRKLYKKALVHLDDTLVPCCALNPFSQISILITDELHLINPQEELLAQWIGYEEEYGSVNDVISALAKWNKNSFDFSRLSRSGKGVAKSKKRAATEQPNTSVISKKKKSDSKDKSVLAGTTESEDGPPPSVGTYAVFLKNIPFTTTEEQLFQLFQHCGKILKVDLLKSLGGKSRGMAQIDFYSEPAVNEALRLNNTLIDDRPMTVQRYYPDSLDSSFHPSTLFISKIPRDASDEELRGCFSKLENVEIVACRIVVDKKTGLSKGHGLVQFSNPLDADRCLENPSQFKIGGKIVTISRSKFPAVSETEIQGDENETSKLSIKPDRTQSTSLTLLKPRGLKLKSAAVKKLPTEESSTNSTPISVNQSVGSKSNDDFRAYFK